MHLTIVLAKIPLGDSFACDERKARAFLDLLKQEGVMAMFGNPGIRTAWTDTFTPRP